MSRKVSGWFFQSKNVFSINVLPLQLNHTAIEKGNPHHVDEHHDNSSGNSTDEGGCGEVKAAKLEVCGSR